MESRRDKKSCCSGDQVSCPRNYHTNVLTALQEYFAKNSSNTFAQDGSFPATIQRIEVCDTAIIFHIDTGIAMSEMRNAVKYARENHIFREYEITKGLSPYELTRYVHIPNITHSTFVRYSRNTHDVGHSFLRFRKPISETMRKSLEAIAGTWIPQTVQV